MSWIKALKIYKDPKMAVMLILGIFSAIPLILIFSTLSFWLSDKGLSVKTIAFFSLVRLPYSFKFLWAPFIDRLELPILGKKLGQRRSWAVLFQTLLIFCIIGLIHTNPMSNPMWTGVFAVCIAFLSASQDIVFDAFRIEYFSKEEQAGASASFVFGYRIGMIIASAGALYLADIISWTRVYEILALSGILGIITILLANQPLENISSKEAPTSKNFFKEAVLAPLADFIKNPAWFWVVLFILSYKICETTLGTVTPKLYTELGFTKTEIATIGKVWGLGATILGGFLGGVFVVRFGLIRSLMICGVLQGLSNLPFAVLAMKQDSLFWLSFSIISDNLAAGMATTAFVAYLSSLCNTAYTATQYALLTSLMALPRDILSSFSGILVQTMGWSPFFVFTATLSLPSLVLLLILNRKVQNLPVQDKSAKTH